ncbi:MAG: lactate utilization protein [Anaerolineales bacterium]|nr:lactate utilization protein [Anaerolineales bacterium]
MSETPTYIGFEEYSEHIPASIPAAVQQATDVSSADAACVAELPEWEQLRQAGSDIRLHTIENMDVYLEQFEDKVKAAGGHVHWAQTAEDANRIVLQIAKEHNVKTVVKSKSMATEEIGLNHFLEKENIQVIETDLGEYIIQLAGTGTIAYQLFSRCISEKKRSPPSSARN